MTVHYAIRKAVSERGLGCCEACGKAGPTDPHHRKLKSQGGLDTLSNLLNVCRACHDRIHREPKQARRRGLLLKHNDHPSSVPVLMWSRLHGGLRLVLLRDDGTIDEDVQPWQELNLWAE